MAVTLPTFTITDPAKEDRLLNAFKPTPQSTKAEASAEYQRWHKAALLGEVLRRERAARRAQAEAGAEPVDTLLD